MAWEPGWVSEVETREEYFFRLLTLIGVFLIYDFSLAAGGVTKFL
jgi:hypothetical protein